MTENKKILLFTDWYEPGYKAGGIIQSCKNLVSLLRDEYDFYIVCSDRDLGENQPYADIAVDRWVEKNPRLHVWYASPSSLNHRNLTRLIQELNPGIVYFNSMYSAVFTLRPLWILIRAKFSGRIILAPRGMLHRGALEKKFLKKTLFLKIFRYAGWYKKITFQATDPQEQKDVHYFFTAEAKVVLAKDTPGFPSVNWIGREKEQGQLDCVFISRIHPKKNLHYFLERLRETNQVQALRFDIYGAEEDADYGRQCRKLASALPGYARVRFMGALPYEAVRDTLRRYHLFILPTLGENFGHAIFESLSVGTPVLISDQTPWRGLATKKAGWDIPLQQPESFVRVIEQVSAMDQETYRHWSYNAWEYAKKYMDQADLTKEYQQLFG